MEKSEREITAVSESVIRRIFDENNVPVFEPLIRFQQEYGGYIFDAGIEHIRFTLLRGAGGYPESNYTGEVEFEVNYDGSPRYYFVCASTDYQMQFFLDEEGVYYEDYQAKASSFDKCVEQLAIWEEFERKEFELLFRHRQLDVPRLKGALSLELIPEASDEYTQWYRNEFIYAEQWNGFATLAASKDCPDKDKLKDLCDATVGR
ncbi:MAG: hypothetical protein J7527_03820 [Chitinophagaceae bacterium]|nr:hypothetical protein [Chitinophagaceae bacterium]